MTISNKNISVVVQGQVRDGEIEVCLSSIRKYLPGATIILSTWDGSNVKGLDYDKLILNVYTNGSLRPEEAIALGAKILIEHFNVLLDLSDIADMTGIMSAKEEDSKLKKLETPIEDLDFSVRAFNCLKRANINTLGDLTAKSELEMMKIRNLGKKSLKEVIDKIKGMGLRFRDED